MSLNLEFDSTVWGLFMMFILFCCNIGFLIYLSLREREKVEAPRRLGEIKVKKVTSRYN